MRSATKRILIAGAGLTAAALFGSLPYQGPWQAQSLPTQHHDDGVPSQAVILADYTSLPSLLGGTL